ncbi:MAG: hypothetical protein ACKOSQ_02200 [Planctomycetaceae bacterium]
MAAEAGAATARVGAIVAALVALAAVGAGGATQPAGEPAPEPMLARVPAPAEADPAALEALAARVRHAGPPGNAGRGTDEAPAPLPGPEWTDPDSVNWADVPEAERGPVRERLLDRRGDRGPPPGGRLLERLRGELRAAALGGRAVGDVVTPGETRRATARWPDPAALRDQLTRLVAAAAPAAGWATATLAHLDAVLATGGPADPAAAAALLSLGEDVDAGMALADQLPDAALATSVRRAALAVARRVAVWRAAASAAGGAAAADRDVATLIAAAAPESPSLRLLDALEGFESAPGAPRAVPVRAAIDALGPATASPAAAIGRAAAEHYMAPNVRVAVHRAFIEKLLPESTVISGPMQDVVLGRSVRGTRRVEQSIGLRLVPDPDEIRAEMVVDGVVTSRTVTESGPVALHSRGSGEFTVRKPLTISATGLAFGRAVGTAANRARLADVRTDFDSVPIMGPMLRSIARNQHDDHRAEAMREVNDKVVSRACREVDAHAEPKFREAADRFRKRAWDPLVGLGLEPKAVALETTADAAAARIRLAGTGQLAAHTPRPRAPADALVSVQVHESSINNACERLGLAGRQFTVEELVRTICVRLGVPPRIPDDLPTEVAVAFADEEPLRIECRDGLVHVRMAIDAIESDRRTWCDIVAQVAYRPVVSGAQVLLERDGPVRLSGAGQQGRMEIGLRTIFGKVFPKERPAHLLPAELTRDPRLAGIVPVQAVSTDGWFALALAQPTQAGGKPAAPTATRPAQPARPVMRR